MSLLPFQEAAVAEILEDLEDGTRAVRLAAPTGSGKTRMLAAVAAGASHPDVVWLWTAPLGVLLDQARQPLVEAGLRPRDLATDRERPHRPGDVWLATLQLLANDDANLHADSDHGPSLLRWRTTLRQDGLRLGVVIDEAHVGLELGRKTTAFADRLRQLEPDLLLAATATPNDERLLTVLWALGLRSVWHVIPRHDAVAAYLVKPRLVLSHLAPGGDPLMGEELRRKILLRHAQSRLDAQAAAAAAHGISLRPLLLLQVANDAGGKAEAEGETFLRETLGWTDAGAVVRADGDSRVLREALGRPGLRALVFKEAGALGFDAPEASVLVSFRPVLAQDRALQAIGRTLRIPPALRQRLVDSSRPLPDDVRELLTTAWICVPDPDVQAGFSQAARALNALEQALDVPIRTEAIPEAPVPAAPGPFGASSPPVSRAVPASPTAPVHGPLFDGPFPSSPPSGLAAPAIPSTNRLKAVYPDMAALQAHAAELGLRIHRRRPATPETPTDPPARLPSEQNADLGLLDALGDDVLWQALEPTPADLQALAPQAHGLIQLRLVEDAMRLDRTDDPGERLSVFLEIEDPDLLALEAHRLLRRRFHHLEYGLQNRLRARLKDHPGVRAMALSPQGVEILFVALMLQRADRLAALLDDLRDARARTTTVALPDALVSPPDLALPRRARNLYGTDMPEPGALAGWRAPDLPEAVLVGGVRTTLAPMDETFALNAPERAFVDLVEDPSLADVVRWWHRNPPRKPWSVGLRRTDRGGLHHPDFVVGLADGRRRLVETKEDAETIARLRRRPPLKSYGAEVFLHAGRDGLRAAAADGQPTGPLLTPLALRGLLQRL
jgi:hypothetical protein